LQVGDRLFEIEKIRVHSHPSCVDGQVAGSCIRYRALPYSSRRIQVDTGLQVNRAAVQGVVTETRSLGSANQR
ncbi:MAG TPA: hypothetical protein VFF22_11015, partial [Pseudomonas sp.]|nr:hypothetical protein [Pseudomonas sp.]